MSTLRFGLSVGELRTGAHGTVPTVRYTTKQAKTTMGGQATSETPEKTFTTWADVVKHGVAVEGRRKVVVSRKSLSRNNPVY